MGHKISVVMATYNRGWALPLSLNSLANQTRAPDEVVIVLKPSGDNSEEVIDRFSRNLNINLIIQKEGNVVDACCLGIERANNEYIAFLDDDAIAERQWIQKYLNLFESIPNAGGIHGIIYSALIGSGQVVRVNREPRDVRVVMRGPHRWPPLSVLKHYDEPLSLSGFPATYTLPRPIIKSVLFSGANMAFRRDAVMGSNLSRIYKGSRICHHFENYLALYARLKGYDTYRVFDPNFGPVVWHIHHPHSLQRTPLRSEFWRRYDLAHNYWRLRILGLETSFPRYLAGLMVTLRKNFGIRLLAYTYGFIKGALLYAYERRRLKAPSLSRYEGQLPKAS